MAPKRRKGLGRRDKVTGDPISPSGRDVLAKSPDSQAKRVITRFGGVKNLVRFMLQAGIRRTEMSVFLWIRNGGLIPPNGVRDIFLAEIKAGIQLTDADWSPYTVVDEPVAVKPPQEPQQAPQTAPASKRWVL
jgi:hypothetical protein